MQMEAIEQPRQSRALTAQRPSIRDWLGLVPHWLTGRRALIIAGIALVAAGLAFGWKWLTAAGIAPLILSLAPCVAMCALGWCMMGKGGQSSCSKQEPPTDAKQP